jgi:hypothetical protein
MPNIVCIHHAHYLKHLAEYYPIFVSLQEIKYWCTSKLPVNKDGKI